MTSLPYLDTAAVEAALTFPALIGAIEAAHRRTPIVVRDTMVGHGENAYFVRNAVDAGRFVGSKLITSTPGNLDRGDLPAVQAVTVIFDASDGRPLAVLDGTSITQWRTAADSALGSRCLSRPDVRRLLVVGAGAMSRPLVRAHTTVRPSIEAVTIWNRTRSRAEETADQLRGEGFTVDVADDLHRAIADADIISTCTRVTEPLVRGQLLGPGTHVDLVGGFTRTTREADDATIVRGRVFVDRRESAFDVGDIIAPIERGVITAADVLGDLHDLVAGRAGRTSADEITVYKNAGGGHFDLITAEHVLRATGHLQA